MFWNDLLVICNIVMFKVCVFVLEKKTVQTLTLATRDLARI